VAHAGIPTYIDDQHAIAHNKIMIIDRQTLITGSFNFTNAGEERREPTGAEGEQGAGGSVHSEVRGAQGSF
jgi:phosphatidylserine/phosphatidylglycerophosphate/cardiolipin synthase-like enzyme